MVSFEGFIRAFSFVGHYGNVYTRIMAYCRDDINAKLNFEAFLECCSLCTSGLSPLQQRQMFAGCVRSQNVEVVGLGHSNSGYVTIADTCQLLAQYLAFKEIRSS